jgi:hypothetical protein
MSAQTVDQIKIGTRLVNSYQTLIVTELKKKYCKGYVEHKGVKHEAFFNYADLQNPHYPVTIVND